MELMLLVFFALISITNPLGTVPIFVGLSINYSKKEKNRTALKAALSVLIILLLSFFVGQYILSFFGISMPSLKIAGGMIITSSGFALLSGKFTEHKGMKKKRVKDDAFTKSDISITPIAIPMLAGPGTISLLITYQQEYYHIEQIISIISAILLASICIYLVLRSAHGIVKFLGASGINALSRIIGFFVIAIGVEYISSAILSLLKT